MGTTTKLALALAIVATTGCVGEIVFDVGEGSPPPFVDPQLGCSLGCHGSDTSNAPPTSLDNETATTAVGVGAHQQHLVAASTWHRQITCSDCHAVPAEVGSPGHMDDADRTAELTFGQVAGMSSTWSGSSCTTWCHGSQAFGGTSPVPTWTQVDGSQSTCGSCHGAPPPAPHPQEANCAGCHPTMEEGSLTFRDPSSHINGVVDVATGPAAGCTSCHGTAESSAPPRALDGATAPTDPQVGAHQAHLRPSTWHRAVACTSCHTVPGTVDAPGHQDGDNIAELTFDALNPAGTFDRATATCATQYCHGNGQGNNGTVVWNTPGALPCTGCHATNGQGMSGDHRKHLNEGVNCNGCHRDVVDQNRNIINANLHVNGVHEIKMANGTWNATTRSCSNTGCHGTERW